MNNWQVSALSEVADFVLGKMLDQVKNKGELRPYLANVNVRWGEFDLEALREMRFEPREMARYSLRYNDIVMCEGGEPGRCAIWKSQDTDLMFQKALHRIRPHDCLDSNFLYYSFLNLRRSDGFAAYFTGATIKHLPREQLAKVEVRFPTIATQQKIAVVLSAYDDLIANNQRRITLLERMAEDIYREWFVRLRFPGHEQSDRTRSDWTFAELGTVCSVLKRGISPNYSETPDTLVINQRCIRAGFVDLAEARGHDTKLPLEKTLQYGDVLINSTGVGTLGRVAVFDLELANLTCDTHVTICRAKSDKIATHYFGFVLRSLQVHFENMAIGSTGQSELSRDAIARTSVLLPPIEIQTKFSDALQPVLQKKRLLRKQTIVLKATRDALLPRLMSGKLAVDALDIHYPPGMANTA